SVDVAHPQAVDRLRAGELLIQAEHLQDDRPPLLEPGIRHLWARPQQIDHQQIVPQLDHSGLIVAYKPGAHALLGEPCADLSRRGIHLQPEFAQSLFLREAVPDTLMKALWECGVSLAAPEEDLNQGFHDRRILIMASHARLLPTSLPTRRLAQRRGR